MCYSNASHHENIKPIKTLNLTFQRFQTQKKTKTDSN